MALGRCFVRWRRVSRVTCGRGRSSWKARHHSVKWEVAYVNRDAELYCRDELRRARAAVLRDSEAFTEVIFAIERMGAIAHAQGGTMQSFGPALKAIADRSPLAKHSPQAAPHWHMSSRPYTNWYERLATKHCTSGPLRGISQLTLSNLLSSSRMV